MKREVNRLFATRQMIGTMLRLHRALSHAEAVELTRASWEEARNIELKEKVKKIRDNNIKLFSLEHKETHC